MRRWILWAGALSVLAGHAEYRAIAQTVQMIESSVTCRSCSIEMRHVVRLTTAELDFAFSPYSSVSRDSKGRFYVYPNHEPSVLTFQANGRLIARIGKRGAGPGEFSGSLSSQAYVMPGDTLVVYDAGNGRRTYFTGLGELIRTAVFPQTYSQLPLVTGESVVGTVLRSKDHAGMQIHLINSEGNLAKSFTSVGSQRKVTAQSPDNARKFAWSRGKRFWAHAENAYSFEQWSKEGDLLGRYVREADWFPPGQQVTRDTPNPMDVFVGLHEAGTGVWTLIRDVSPRWKSAYPGYGPEKPSPTAQQAQGLYDSVFEFIDIKRGTVVARKKYEPYFQGFVRESSRLVNDKPLAYTIREARDGDLVIDIYELSLRR